MSLIQLVSVYRLFDLTLQTFQKGIFRRLNFIPLTEYLWDSEELPLLSESLL
jgi:hypothetical protein